MNEARPTAKNRTLLRDLLLRSGTVVLVLLLAAGLLSYMLATHYAAEVHDRWLSDSARTLAAQVRFVAGKPTLDLPAVALDMFAWDETDSIYYQVVGDDGMTVLANAKLGRIESAFRDRREAFGDLVVDGRAVRAVAVWVPSPSGDGHALVTVGETLGKRRALTREVLLELVPLHLALILAGALFLYWALRSGLRALSETTAAIHARGALDTQPVTTPSPPPLEIQPLIDAINDLLNRIRVAQQAQHRFLANAAHQLRTPVASVEVQLERALREPTAEGRQQALAVVGRSVRRLGRLLHQLLTLARIEPDAQASLPLVPCDLAAIGREVVERHIDAAVGANVDLGYEGPGNGVMVEGDSTLIGEMLGNLVENALQHGRPGGRITVGIRSTPPTVLVEDDGPGIEPNERERVFERFYRGAGASGTGSGLGLSIVKEIAERHAATFNLESATAAGTGTRVSIAFPAAPTADHALP